MWRVTFRRAPPPRISSVSAKVTPFAVLAAEEFPYSSGPDCGRNMVARDYPPPRGCRLGRVTTSRQPVRFRDEESRIPPHECVRGLHPALARRLVSSARLCRVSYLAEPYRRAAVL